MAREWHGGGREHPCTPVGAVRRRGGRQPHPHGQLGDSATTTVTASPDGATGTCALTHAYATDGVYDATLSVAGAQGAASAPSPVQIVAYDPSAGFVTGGGWIASPAGAYAPIPP